ncbi:hypothetical protein CYMTET_20214 [Cymbomonas tetramitiformis]|uniref:N-acetyltransferase domain-containing protein n=1 Tax=Cymbomonas tetramitiformis TaxID=36881 RepID=A0AAE0G4I5_9CHLO|nr:hypothetical protein CYMTET_20214 [Cymbomonas tetramitiformis]
MVFIHASRSGFGRIPTDDGYGFNFSSNSEKVDDDEDDGFSLKKRKLMDRTVQVQGSSYTMRFMLGEFEYESAQIIGGQVYNGDGNDEKQVIARLGAALFDIRHPDLQRAGYVMAQGLHCVADAMTQEVYQACTALFTPSGEPKGAFQTLLRSKGQLRKLVYISGVFVDQAHMGKGLGLEFVRNLLRSLQDEGLWAGPGSVALLCPCGDPPKGTDELRDPQAPTPDNFQQLWRSAFNKLSTHFAKIGFAHCDSGKRNPAGPSDQKMYSFLEADALDGASASPGPPRAQAGDDNPRRTKRAKGPDSAPGGLKCRRAECQSMGTSDDDDDDDDDNDSEDEW